MHVDLDPDSPALSMDRLRLWALVEPVTKAGTVDVEFLVGGTGQELPQKACEYIGSIRQPPYIWHVFQVMQK